MEALIVILSILLLAAIIAIDYVIASEFYIIAIEKGHNEKKYFWISFLFGLAGWLLVIALPAKKTQIKKEKIITKENENIEDEKINEIISYVNGLYIKKILTSNSKTVDSSIKIDGVNYSSSDWVADGKIKWFWKDNKILHGIKEKTKNAPYVLKFELVETGINVTGFPDELYNGVYIKK